ncbi:PsbP-related protein [Ferruginibacter sp. SUN106]|uniref:PsbP-related protein n=1 Tax=Ferruginibacter sp. SUN106 TaxID=2978348 RepID=UPI003D3673EF
MKPFLIAIFLSTPFWGFSQTESSLHYSTYSNEKYTIAYPETWRIDTSNMPRAEFSFFSPKEDATDTFSDNVNLIVRDLTKQHLRPDATLDEFEAFSEKQIKTLAVDVTEFSAKKIELNNTECYEINFNLTYQQYRLHTKQYYFISNSKSIVLTMSCEQKKLDKFQPVWNRISGSFIYATSLTM